jgi:hypothetical protein
MTTNSTTFNLSTSTRKAGKLGITKSAAVIDTASNLTNAAEREQFVAQVNELINATEAERVSSFKRYSRTNQVKFANAAVRAAEKLATLERALKIASSLTF